MSDHKISDPALRIVGKRIVKLRRLTVLASSPQNMSIATYNLREDTDCLRRPCRWLPCDGAPRSRAAHVASDDGRARPRRTPAVRGVSHVPFLVQWPTRAMSPILVVVYVRLPIRESVKLTRSVARSGIAERATRRLINGVDPLWPCFFAPRRRRAVQYLSYPFCTTGRVPLD